MPETKVPAGDLIMRVYILPRDAAAPELHDNSYIMALSVFV